MKHMYHIAILFVCLCLAICSTSTMAVDLWTKLPPDGGGSLPTKGELDLIGGEEVPKDHPDYDSIVRISTNGASCTATLVGPKVLVTAAHCGKTDAVATFKINEKQYQATLTRHPSYPGVDHDMNLGLLSEALPPEVKPESVGTEAVKVADPVLMYGYGCINPGGGGGNDGILRKGFSEVQSFSSKDMVLKKPNGAALCFGDSGGPGFVVSGQNRFTVGVASKGNIKDTSYLANLTLPESKQFMMDWATAKAVEICGINKDCSKPPGPEPEIIILASEKLGEMKFTLKPETLDPLYVKQHMQMLLSFLEDGLATGELVGEYTIPACK